MANFARNNKIPAVSNADTSLAKRFEGRVSTGVSHWLSTGFYCVIFQVSHYHAVID